MEIKKCINSHWGGSLPFAIAIAKGRLPPPATGRWRERGGGVGKKGHLPPPLNFFSSFNRFRPKKKRQKRELLLRAIVRKNLDEYFSFFQRGGEGVASYRRRRAGGRGVRRRCGRPCFFVRLSAVADFPKFLLRLLSRLNCDLFTRS